ncbi:MAG: ARMT1-like domain-containing protein [Fervidicoccaceae archaeon]
MHGLNESGCSVAMRVNPQCFGCLLSVRLRELIECAERDGALPSLVSLFLRRAAAIFESESELTKLATKLYRELISLAPCVVESHRARKRESIREALLRLGAYSARLETLRGEKRFAAAVRVALAGNLLDSGVAGHEPSWIEPNEVEVSELEIDHVPELYRLVSRGLKVLYLLDNAGEAVFDSLLVEEMTKLGCEVVAAVKSEPGFQNDVTINDVKETPLKSLFPTVIETGTNASSVHLDEVSAEFLEELRSCNIVVAKGMSHYEYLTEIHVGRPVFHLLVAKCDVVARSLGVQRGSFVAMVRL